MNPDKKLLLEYGDIYIENASTPGEYLLRIITRRDPKGHASSLIARIVFAENKKMSLLTEDKFQDLTLENCNNAFSLLKMLKVVI